MKKFNNGSIYAMLISILAVASAGPITVLAASPATVNLASAGNFVILSKTGISTTGATSIVGDIGLSPAAASYITGFSLMLPAAGSFSTSPLITGKVYAPGYADPTPANLTAAILDMQTAYTDAMGRAPTVTELGAGNIGGLTLASGVYKWGTGVTIPTDVTLSGGANDIWIFQIAQTLNISSATKIILAGGAQASNIFWVVGGQTTLGTTSVFNGNILDQTAIVMNTGARLNGRALAQTAVTLDANMVTVPSTVTPAPVVTPTPTPTIPVTTSTSGTTQTSTQTSGSTFTSAQSATSASSEEESRKILLQDQLNKLVIQVQSLQANGSASASAKAMMNANANASFKRNLVMGAKGEDVRALQVWLNANGYILASSGPGSKGNETMHFGGLTKKALARFQAKVGISPAVGNFGVMTRARIGTN